MSEQEQSGAQKRSSAGLAPLRLGCADGWGVGAARSWVSADQPQPPVVAAASEATEGPKADQGTKKGTKGEPTGTKRNQKGAWTWRYHVYFLQRRRYLLSGNRGHVASNRVVSMILL